ncbi:hypothetical protein SteCoe_28238 [Stentor coeruleus]|uniref:Kinesin-like protein n=1 Tax=Stentor coeruleus TaxID=5963 RepID=A0A1R2B8N2_9CILI|nr:hypothetical protein SteCoe_28238 [Stentor coeruleus]
MEGPRIQVVVRIRPLSAREIRKNHYEIIEVTSPCDLVVKEEKLKVDLTKYLEGHNFTFDQVFNKETTNQDIYLTCVQPLISAAFDRMKITCFAYGQTGSGKTYTMMGEKTIPGLYIMAAEDVFKILSKSHTSLKIFVSFYEIYCGKLHDLLNERQQLFAREDAKQNVNIIGLKEWSVNNVDDIMKVIDFGLSVRMTGVTGANDESSRSHAVLQISLKAANKLHGKISFIDLAGSERGADTIDNTKQTRIDGAEINKSLLALKECIRALDQEKSHTPFRGSILTQVLKDSFVGRCKTVMIANISPASNNCEHTLNTLRYADRVKELKKINKPQRREDALADALMLPRQPSNTVRQMKPANSPVSQANFVPAVPLNHNVSSKTPPPKAVEKFLSPNWMAKSEKDLMEMSEGHEKLINLILTEEEELIASHRQHIDNMVGIIKDEMGILHEVDQPGSDVDEYATALRSMLEQQILCITEIKNKLENFTSHLRTEEEMSRKFYKLQSEILDLHDN